MDWQPALLGLLIAILVLARFMQDGDADVAIFGHWRETYTGITDRFVLKQKIRILYRRSVFVEKWEKSNLIHSTVKPVERKSCQGTFYHRTVAAF